MSDIDRMTLASQPRRLTLRGVHLRQAARFQAVRAQGRWWTHRLLAVGLLANGLEISRCGFSVGKRLGNAVVRNRVRRRLREAVRQQWQDVAPGWDVVFAAREPLCEAPFTDVQDAVSVLLRRARLTSGVHS